MMTQETLCLIRANIEYKNNMKRREQRDDDDADDCDNREPNISDEAASPKIITFLCKKSKETVRIREASVEGSKEGSDIIQHLKKMSISLFFLRHEIIFLSLLLLHQT